MPGGADPPRPALGRPSQARSLGAVGGLGRAVHPRQVGHRRRGFDCLWPPGEHHQGAESQQPEHDPHDPQVLLVHGLGRRSGCRGGKGSIATTGAGAGARSAGVGSSRLSSAGAAAAVLRRAVSARRPAPPVAVSRASRPRIAGPQSGVFQFDQPLHAVEFRLQACKSGFDSPVVMRLLSISSIVTSSFVPGLPGHRLVWHRSFLFVEDPQLRVCRLGFDLTRVAAAPVPVAVPVPRCRWCNRRRVPSRWREVRWRPAPASDGSVQRIRRGRPRRRVLR